MISESQQYIPGGRYFKKTKFHEINLSPLDKQVSPSAWHAGGGSGSIAPLIIIIIIIIIIFINCNSVVTRWQWLFYMYTNMKEKVTRKFKSGGLHEKHVRVLATWKLGNHLSIRL
jgi:hypothetical protein